MRKAVCHKASPAGLAERLSQVSRAVFIRISSSVGVGWLHFPYFMLRTTVRRSLCFSSVVIQYRGSKRYSTCLSSSDTSLSVTSSTIKPPITPDPSSTHHSSLAEFHAYATRTSLSPTSPTYIGTLYEYTCLNTLSRLNLGLTRIGGRADAGIDLLGHWTLPSLSYPLPTFVQCKALKAKVTPNLVRELEGVFPGAPRGWRREDCIGILCAPREATKGVMEGVRACQKAVVWMMIDGNGRLKQVLWNARAAAVGFEGIGVQTRYVPDEQGKVEKEAILTWKGEVWRGGE